MSDIIVRQVTLIGKGIVEPALRVIGEIVIFVGIVLMMLLVSPGLVALLAFVVLPIVILYLQKFKSLSRSYGERANRSLEYISELSASFSVGWRQLVVDDLRQPAVKMLNEASHRFAVYDRLANLISLAPRYFLELFLAIFLIACFTISQIYNVFGFGELVFVAAAGLRMLPIVTSISNALVSFQFNRAMMNNINSITAQKLSGRNNFKKRSTSARTKSVTKSENNVITLRSVGFGYEGAESLFANVTTELQAGDFVLISGKSGAGKTTLMDLICGIRSPNTGEILYSGVTIRELVIFPSRFFTRLNNH